MIELLNIKKKTILLIIENYMWKYGLTLHNFLILLLIQKELKKSLF